MWLSNASGGVSAGAYRALSWHQSSTWHLLDLQPSGLQSFYDASSSLHCSTLHLVDSQPPSLRVLFHRTQSCLHGSTQHLSKTAVQAAILQASMLSYEGRRQRQEPVSDVMIRMSAWPLCQVECQQGCRPRARIYLIFLGVTMKV